MASHLKDFNLIRLASVKNNKSQRVAVFVCMSHMSSSDVSSGIVSTPQYFVPLSCYYPLLS
jgi:hypothetical protein